MTKNNTDVYEMYLDDIYQATGSIKMLAEHIGKSRKTVDGMIHQGNNKNYSFRLIGKYAQIYALYKKEEFVMFGTMDQLVERTGMTKKRLEWFRTPSSEKRGGNYQVVKIEGEFEVVKKRQQVKHRINVYEVTINYKTFSGTVDDIAKKTGWSESKARTNSKFIGHRLAKLKGINLKTREVHYGSLEEIADWAGTSQNRVRSIVAGQRYSPNFDFTFTGQYIVDLISADKPKIEKPTTEHIDTKPVDTHKTVPMSRYAQELFEWSTRHLRRDA